MAAAVGTPYSPPSPPDTNSSATMSPVYPDRPIRPLPKRSLRERLSQEVADQIPYPSAPQSAESVFNIHYGDGNPRAMNGVAGSLQEIDRYDRALIEAQEDCEEGCERVSLFSRFTQFEKGISYQEATHGIPRATQTIAHSITSSNESIDGYDSFENTNNKKKRKIPLSGGLGSHAASLSASLSNDLANMGLSGARERNSEDFTDVDDAGMQQGGTGFVTSPSGTGISGAGRGRYGRVGRRDTNSRGPLTVSGNAGNLPAARNSSVRAGETDFPTKEQGIISAAIAEAATTPINPSHGQENISLLEQYPQKNSAPANTQFTFTCESDASKNVAWPNSQSAGSNDACVCPTPVSQTLPDHPSFTQKGFSTQGTQTSPVMAGQQGSSAPQPQNAQQAQVQPKKPRRSPAKRYAMAARERRLQQEYNNFHNPPRDEDIWICEFCEYESIFGVPPEALVRQYEIKDRRDRKRLAEKRRLLEKAKMKGRKGKKGTKNANKNHATQPHYNDKQHANTPPAVDPGLNQNQEDRSDEYYADYYDMEPPIAAPVSVPETPTRIPQPVNQHNQNPRIAQADEVHPRRTT